MADTAIVKISNNEVCQDKGRNVSYDLNIANNVIRISVKIRTGATMPSFLAGLIARYDFILDNGYSTSITPNGICITKWPYQTLASSTNYKPQANTSYIYEFELSNSTLKATLKDYPAGNVLQSINTVDTTYSAGKVGFCLADGGIMVYLDDFKIEKYE